MLVAACFDHVRIRLLPPLGFGARLGLATSALVVLVCIVQSWILAPPAAILPAGPIPVGADLWESQAPILVTEPRSRQLRAPGELVTGERAGTVAVGISLESLQALQRRTFTTATVFTALFTLIAVLAAVMLTRAITRPLTALASAADAIARGDLDAKVEVPTQDEIGRLARSFNAMVESLRRSRAALEEKVAELERANRLKSEFLATISHELRTPLHVIIGYVEMLADGRGGHLDEEQTKMIAAIDRYSRLQLDLITNVLDFARLSSGQISFQVERFALAPLLAEIEALHARRLQNPRLALTVTVDPDLPMFETDRVKLLANALGGTVSVTSRIGEGSTFRIDVPCCLRAPGAPTPEAVPAAVVALDKVTRNVARLPRRPRAAGTRTTRSATK